MVGTLKVYWKVARKEKEKIFIKANCIWDKMPFEKKNLHVFGAAIHRLYLAWCTLFAHFIKHGLTASVYIIIGVRKLHWPSFTSLHPNPSKQKMRWFWFSLFSNAGIHNLYIQDLSTRFETLSTNPSPQIEWSSFYKLYWFYQNFLIKLFLSLLFPTTAAVWLSRVRFVVHISVYYFQRVPKRLVLFIK